MSALGGPRFVVAAGLGRQLRIIVKQADLSSLKKPSRAKPMGFIAAGSIMPFLSWLPPPAAPW